MKKVLKIILGIVITSLIVCAIVLYAIYPNETKKVIKDILDVLNTPLPIVGVTTIAILFFVWQVVVKTRFGKKALYEIQREYERRYDDLKVEKDKLEKERELNQAKIDYVMKSFYELCNLLPNKKVNELGETFVKGLDYGETKETTNSDTKEK